MAYSIIDERSGSPQHDADPLAALSASRSREEIAGALNLLEGRLGLWSFDIASGALDTSRLCRTILGRDPRGPFSYADLHDAIHEADRLQLHEAISSSIETGFDTDVEFRVTLPGGKVRWIQMRAQATYEPDGSPKTVVGSCIDARDRATSPVERNRI